VQAARSWAIRRAAITRAAVGGAAARPNPACAPVRSVLLAAPFCATPLTPPQGLLFEFHQGALVLGVAHHLQHRPGALRLAPHVVCGRAEGGGQGRAARGARWVAGSAAAGALPVPRPPPARKALRPPRPAPPQPPAHVTASRWTCPRCRGSSGCGSAAAWPAAARGLRRGLRAAAAAAGRDAAGRRGGGGGGAWRVWYRAHRAARRRPAAGAGAAARHRGAPPRRARARAGPRTPVVPWARAWRRRRRHRGASSRLEPYRARPGRTWGPRGGGAGLAFAGEAIWGRAAGRVERLMWLERWCRSLCAPLQRREGPTPRAQRPAGWPRPPPLHWRRGAGVGTFRSPFAAARSPPSIAAAPPRPHAAAPPSRAAPISARPAHPTLDSRAAR
jgi:hypothetical protein